MPRRERSAAAGRTSLGPDAGPTLETERLLLTPFAEADVAELHAFFTDVDVRRYLLDGEVMPLEWVEREARASAERFAAAAGAGLWSVRERGADAALAGFVGFRPFFDPPELQLLYGLLPRYWGRGLATEAARRALAFAFEELGVEEVRAATDTPNEASIAVLERLGFEEWRRSEEGQWGTVFFRVTRFS